MDKGMLEQNVFTHLSASYMSRSNKKFCSLNIVPASAGLGEAVTQPPRIYISRLDLSSWLPGPSVRSWKAVFARDGRKFHSEGCIEHAAADIPRWCVSALAAAATADYSSTCSASSVSFIVSFSIVLAASVASANFSAIFSPKFLAVSTGTSVVVLVFRTIDSGLGTPSMPSNSVSKTRISPVSNSETE